MYHLSKFLRSATQASENTTRDECSVSVLINIFLANLKSALFYLKKCALERRFYPLI